MSGVKNFILFAIFIFYIAIDKVSCQLKILNPSFLSNQYQSIEYYSL